MFGTKKKGNTVFPRKSGPHFFDNYRAAEKYKMMFEFWGQMDGRHNDFSRANFFKMCSKKLLNNWKACEKFRVINGIKQMQILIHTYTHKHLAIVDKWQTCHVHYYVGAVQAKSQFHRSSRRLVDSERNIFAKDIDLNGN
jgi:hypothetical protein